MKPTIAALKAQLDFAALVAETHAIDPAGKTLCPFHDDHHPSCHIYEDGFKCFACEAYGDALDWLERVQQLTKAEAVRALAQRIGLGPSVPLVRAKPVKTPPKVDAAKPVPLPILDAHRRRAAELELVPRALAGRGFTLPALRRLGVADAWGDALLPITSPDGSVLAIKRRLAKPRGKQRYRYETPGCGTPAWCSPAFRSYDTVLVIEGELNSMACWLALQDAAVMGTAGTSGGLYLDALGGKHVYVYGDGDQAGQRARDRWAGEAAEVGAEVYLLEPWKEDACEIAGTWGLIALAVSIDEGIRKAEPFVSARPERFDAKAAASNHLPSLLQKPGLTQAYPQRKGLGNKLCL